MGYNTNSKLFAAWLKESRGETLLNERELCVAEVAFRAGCDVTVALLKKRIQEREDFDRRASAEIELHDSSG